jgi:hypothetical protein
MDTKNKSYTFLLVPLGVLAPRLFTLDGDAHPHQHSACLRKNLKITPKGVGGSPKAFSSSPNLIFVCELNPHVTFHNPRLDEKERKNSEFLSGHRKGHMPFFNLMGF